MDYELIRRLEHIEARIAALEVQAPDLKTLIGDAHTDLGELTERIEMLEAGSNIAPGPAPARPRKPK